MPRIFNQAAWCVLEQPTNTEQIFPLPPHPRQALVNPAIARYFHHYISSIAPWYDLSDGSRHFATCLTELALTDPLPFAAVIALAAIQISQTTAPSARTAAEYYHGHCVRLLLVRLKDDSSASDDGDRDGITLASICLLRSYEILSEEVDPNRHLRGAYSLAVSRTPLLREDDLSGRGGLRGAGFWNYLREDITFSLFQRCPLKVGLEQVELFVWRGDDVDGDHGYLNAVTLILGRIINECFGRETVCRRTMATLSQKPSNGPAVIKPSAAEIKNNTLSARNLELAVRHLHADGLVVVEDAVPHPDLDALNAKMVPDARYLQSLGEDGPFNYNQGNLQQDPPPVAEYFFPSIFTNKIATQITSSILGPRPKWTFCSANSAMPPSSPDASPQRQPVHSDADFDHPRHPFALVVNVPLVTMTPRNGSTELWLGTHHLSDLSAQEGAHGERASGRIKQHLLDARRAERGPCQPVVKKGSVVVRDLRLWHAGMPNLSEDEVRVMLAFIHFAPWYRNPMRLRLGEDVKTEIENVAGELDVPVDWVGRDEVLGEYLRRGFGNSYDFGQEA
ncbi:hypothetical protein PpBr36_03828 [Pyricularia pennisetigena]|uniref:hypothetical protein n=1 Tax=Pyricularia pennisetigena TaxID=1578925 RepID=UPI00114E32BD|nr:hypothetical protein PpBr36_03828 [Pyricularia pennisetigena]TLS30620.1 hypothetical protein PpBr36_03828 [Pyricularia pennisetigena]